MLGVSPMASCSTRPATHAAHNRHPGVQTQADCHTTLYCGPRRRSAVP